MNMMFPWLIDTVKDFGISIVTHRVLNKKDASKNEHLVDAANKAATTAAKDLKPDSSKRIELLAFFKRLHPQEAGRELARYYRKYKKAQEKDPRGQEDRFVNLLSALKEQLEGTPEGAEWMFVEMAASENDAEFEEYLTFIEDDKVEQLIAKLRTHVSEFAKPVIDWTKRQGKAVGHELFSRDSTSAKAVAAFRVRNADSQLLGSRKGRSRWSLR